MYFMKGASSQGKRNSTFLPYKEKYTRSTYAHCVLYTIILVCHVGKKIVYGKYSIPYVGRIAKNLRVNISKKEIRVYYFKILIKLLEQIKDVIYRDLFYLIVFLSHKKSQIQLISSSTSKRESKIILQVFNL